MREEPLKSGVRKSAEPVSEMPLDQGRGSPAPQADIFGLEHFLVNLLGVLVFLNGLLGVAVYVWQMYIRLKGVESYGVLLLYGADLYLAYHLLRRKPWIRTAFVVRSLVGILMLFVLAGVSGRFTEAVAQTILWAAVLILLSGRVERFQARLLTFAAFVFLLYTDYTAFDALFFRQKLVEQVSGGSERTYCSRKYRFCITVPEHWIIIEKRDFSKVQKALVSMKAEAAFVTGDEKSYCAVIPEDVENVAYGYDTDYKLEVLRENFLRDLQETEGVQITSNRSDYLYGDGGFEIKWTVEKENIIYKYLLLYGIYGQTGIQMLGWTSEMDPAAVFEEMRTMLRDIEL